MEVEFVDAKKLRKFLLSFIMKGMERAYAAKRMEKMEDFLAELAGVEAYKEILVALEGGSLQNEERELSIPKLEAFLQEKREEVRRMDSGVIRHDARRENVFETMLRHLREGKLAEAVEFYASRPDPNLPTVCIGLGVLDFQLESDLRQENDQHLSPPRPGAREFLKQLNEIARVVIITHLPAERIWKWLREYAMDQWVENVTDRIPPAVAFIMDPAISFRGNYEEVLREVNQRSEN